MESGADGGEERLAVDAFERAADEPLAAVEEREAQRALLHAARIARDIALGEYGEHVGERGHGGIADGGKRFGGLDAQPEVVGTERLAER